MDLRQAHFPLLDRHFRASRAEQSHHHRLNHERSRLVLLAAWCGLRFGEVSELRRKDLNSDCSVLTVTRAVTHRTDPNAADKGSAAKAERCRIDSTKGNEDT